MHAHRLVDLSILLAFPWCIIEIISWSHEVAWGMKEKLLSFHTCSYLLFYNVQWQWCSEGSIYGGDKTDWK